MQAKKIAASAAIFLFLFVASGRSAIAGDGVVAGWDSQDGRVLLSELNCIACHDAGERADEVGRKAAPILAKVGARVTPQYLYKFLDAPHATKPGTTMPDPMHGLSKGQRAERVDALVHYLVSRGGPIDQRACGASEHEIARGRELFHTVGCVACHKPFDPPPAHKIDKVLEGSNERQDTGAVSLSQQNRPSTPLPPLAMKTTVDELAAFLRNPLHVRPSGRMPSLSLQPGEARSLSAYLLRDQYTEGQTAPGGGVGFAFYRGNFKKAADLVNEKPDFQGELPLIDLEAVLAKAEAQEGKPLKSNFGVRFYGLLEIPQDGEYRFWTKSDDGSIIKIDGQVVVANDGSHGPQEKEGAVKLSKGRHDFELAFMQGSGGFELSASWRPPNGQRQPIGPGVLLSQAAAMLPTGIRDFQVDAEKAERGRRLFVEMRCASCHDAGEKFEMQRAAKPLGQLTAGDGCLSATPGAGAPRYDFDDAQRKALQETLQRIQLAPVQDSTETKLHMTMSRMKCYACHERNDLGGPSPEKKNYFVYDRVVDLGDEGRLPPPLPDAGAKLTDQGFHDMLFGGEKYRTYMATRMPQFGKENIGHVVELFVEADEKKIAPHEPEFSPRHVDDGRFLTGNKALACFNCHAWGEHRLPGAEGMDLLESHRRLRPEWFHAWLKDPQSMRRGTRMPSGWSDGETFFPDLQGGDVDAQIDAVWAYLSVGKKGGFPPGLSPDDDTLLTPSNEPLVFRTFVDKIGAHCILVGFRQRTHMAFDANRVRAVAAWTGAFTTTKPVWSGRAGQYAKIPSSEIVWLPEGPPFAHLESNTSPWPADKPKAKMGSRRTPDGWRFRGYRFTPLRTPTFVYDVGKVRVEETPATEFLRDSALLKREFALRSDKPVERMFFRAAAGEAIVRKGDEFLVDDKLRFRLELPEGVAPFIREANGKQELIVPLELAKQGGEHGLKFAVEMRW